jgi:copper(I)-binding protein
MRLHAFFFGRIRAGLAGYPAVVDETIFEEHAMKIKSLIALVALVASALNAAAHDAVEVQNAWVRATVKGQMATGAFMTLTAHAGAKLVGVSTAAAGVVQVHEMKMDGGVMTMNEVKGGLDLPAGKVVELKPGGYHVMLMDLKAPLLKDSTMPLTLVFKDAKGIESRLDLKVPVAVAAPHAAMDHSAHPMQPGASHPQ